MTIDDAASELELSHRDIREITREINMAAERKGFEPMVVLREASVVLPNKRTVQRQVFRMSDAVARMIRAHERARRTELVVASRGHR